MPYVSALLGDSATAPLESPHPAVALDVLGRERYRRTRTAMQMPTHKYPGVLAVAHLGALLSKYPHAAEVSGHTSACAAASFPSRFTHQEIA
jgi:hypothetical protein